MIAHLYICDQSFVYNGQDSDCEVERKLLEFKLMVNRANCIETMSFILTIINLQTLLYFRTK